MTTALDPRHDPAATAHRPARELLTSPWTLGFAAVWLTATAWILLTDRSVLPLSDQDPLWYFSGALFAVVALAVLFRLAGDRPVVDHRHGPTFRRPGLELGGTLLWCGLVLVVGARFGISTHLAFVGLSPGAQAIWDEQTATTTLVWCAYNAVLLGAVPYLVFRYVLRYDADSLLLRFGRPRVWAPYFLVVGLLGYLPVVTPAYWTTSAAGHLATVVLFTLGSFLPIMVTTQSIVAPRIAVLTRSWPAATVLTGLVYALLNVTEAFLAWDTPAQVALSLAWFVQVTFWGVVKAVTTLRTGNAWLHIATTHTIHLSEAPAVAQVLRL